MRELELVRQMVKEGAAMSGESLDDIKMTPREWEEFRAKVG